MSIEKQSIAINPEASSLALFYKGAAVNKRYNCNYNNKPLLWLDRCLSAPLWTTMV